MIFLPLDAIRAVRSNRTLRAHERLVVLTLISHANDDGVAFPSGALLVKETALSKASVWRALAELERRGWIARRSVPVAVGKGQHNKYTLTVSVGDSLKGRQSQAETVSQGDWGVSQPEPRGCLPVSHDLPNGTAQSELPIYPKPPGRVGTGDRKVKKATDERAAAAGRKSRCPSSVAPPEVLLPWLSAHDMKLTTEVARFLDFHAGKGNTMADWRAAWRTWQGNGARFGRRTAAVQPGDASTFETAIVDLGDEPLPRAVGASP